MVWVDARHAIHVLGKIDDESGASGLAAERSAAAAREDGDVVRPREVDGRDDVALVTRGDDADGDLAIVGSVVRINGDRAAIEANFPLDRHHELFTERSKRWHFAN